jgi:NAD-dependent dihydropyrimidine dehydrogenase PreA subunit
MTIPRELIPWHPTIDDGLCSNCGVCVAFCAQGVYKTDGVRTVVASPNNCVVGCSYCVSECCVGAITFPEMEQFMEKLGELRALRALRMRW